MRAGSRNHQVEREIFRQDVRAKVPNGLSWITDQLHHRRPKEDGLTIAEVEDSPRQVG